jgi:hypothetical protein
MKLSFLVQLIFLLVLVVSLYLIFTNQVEGKTKMILIILCIVIGIYLFSKMSIFKDYDEIVNTPTSAKEEQTMDNLKPTDGNFCISCWIFIDDWNYRYGEKKVILRKKTEDESVVLPEISLDPYKNDLLVEMNVYAENDTAFRTAVETALTAAGESYDESSTYGCSGEKLAVTPDDGVRQAYDGGDSGLPEISCPEGSTKQVKVENINMQKWVNIIFSVNTRTLDLYINGKLVKTQEFNNTIDTNVFNYGGITVTPNGGFGGFISKVQYYPYYITPRKAWNIYKSGFGSAFESGLDKYNMSLSLYEDSIEKKKYYIF